MNILYIDHYAGSLRDGMEYRPYYLAREWKKLGHNVRVIGADYSHLRTKQPVVEKNFSIEMIDGIEYQWVKTIRYEGNGLKRALTMMQFTGKLLAEARSLCDSFRPDLVITSSCYPLDAFAGNRIAKKSKAVYVHEAHDVWPLTLVELGGISKYNPFVVLLAIAEKYAYKNAQKVISILPNTLEHMMENKLGEKSKFVHIPNGIVKEDWENQDLLTQAMAGELLGLKKEGKFIVMYVGGHAMSNALDTLIDAAEKNTANADVAFVLVGKGSEKERLMEKAKSLSNVRFYPPVSKTQIPDLLGYADAVYIGAKRCTLYRYGVSMNKVYDYMMSGKPILYGVEASNNDVRDAQCGISFQSEDAEALCQAITAMKEMPQAQRDEMGRNGYAWVSEYCDYRILAQKFLDEIMS